MVVAQLLMSLRSTAFLLMCGVCANLIFLFSLLTHMNEPAYAAFALMHEWMQKKTYSAAVLVVFAAPALIATGACVLFSVLPSLTKTGFVLRLRDWALQKTSVSSHSALTFWPALAASLWFMNQFLNPSPPTNYAAVQHYLGTVAIVGEVACVAWAIALGYVTFPIAHSFGTGSKASA